MLRIKEDISLKKLEKYGFKLKLGALGYKYYVKDGIFVDVINPIIPSSERLVTCDYTLNDKELDTLFELIKDGIVERIKHGTRTTN